MHVCMRGENYVGDTHMHSVLLSVSGETAVDAKQQSSRWALQPAPKPPEHRLSKAWAPHFQSEKHWGSRRVHHILSLLPHCWAIIGCTGESYAWSRRSHPHVCQIVPVILCPGYLEFFPCAMTVRTKCVKEPSGDTEVLFYIRTLQFIFKESHSSSHLCPGSFHPLNLKCPTSTKLGSKHCCSPFIVSNESHWDV